MFVVNKHEMQGALKQVMSVVGKNNTMEILSYIKLSAYLRDALGLTAGDLEVFAESEIPLEGCDGGELCVHAESLRAAINGVDGDVVRATRDEGNNQLTIQGDERKFVIPFLSADEFPAIDREDAGTNYDLPPGILPRIIGSCSHAIHTTTSNMNGVYLSAHGDKLIGVATDGHRLSLAVMELETQDTGSFLLPEKACKIVKGFGGVIDVHRGATKVAIECGGNSITASLPTEEFPAYERIVQAGSDETETITVETASLVAAVESCSAFSSKESRCVTLRADKDQLSIIGFGPNGHATASISCVGGPIEMHINARYLVQALKAIYSTEVFIKAARASDVGCPIRIFPVDHGIWSERLEIIMPMRG
jgi:DNA polymerase-3 subunit beta